MKGNFIKKKSDKLIIFYKLECGACKVKLSAHLDFPNNKLNI